MVAKSDKPAVVSQAGTAATGMFWGPGFPLNPPIPPPPPPKIQRQCCAPSVRQCSCFWCTPTRIFTKTEVLHNGKEEAFSQASVFYHGFAFGVMTDVVQPFSVASQQLPFRPRRPRNKQLPRKQRRRMLSGRRKRRGIHQRAALALRSSLALSRRSPLPQLRLTMTRGTTSRLWRTWSSKVLSIGSRTRQTKRCLAFLR